MQLDQQRQVADAHVAVLSALTYLVANLNLGRGRGPSLVEAGKNVLLLAGHLVRPKATFCEVCQTVSLYNGKLFSSGRRHRALFRLLELLTSRLDYLVLNRY